MRKRRNQGRRTGGREGRKECLLLPRTEYFKNIYRLTK